MPSATVERSRSATWPHPTRSDHLTPLGVPSVVLDAAAALPALRGTLPQASGTGRQPHTPDGPARRALLRQVYALHRAACEGDATLPMAVSDPYAIVLHLAERAAAGCWSAPREAHRAWSWHVPLAARLGLPRLKADLEDAAFAATDPAAYADVAARIEQRCPDRDVRAVRAQRRLSMLLRDAGITTAVTGRGKSVHSAWQKETVRGVRVQDAQDLVGLRAVTASVEDCYAALETIINRFGVSEGSIDDYVVYPRENGYRSVHVIVTDRDGAALEVQVRTWAMHAAAEFGTAAHWRYKECPGDPVPGQVSIPLVPAVSWLQPLVASRAVRVDTSGFLSDLRSAPLAPLPCH